MDKVKIINKVREKGITEAISAQEFNDLFGPELSSRTVRRAWGTYGTGIAAILAELNAKPFVEKAIIVEEPTVEIIDEEDWDDDPEDFEDAE